MGNKLGDFIDVNTLFRVEIDFASYESLRTPGSKFRVKVCSDFFTWD